MSSVPPGPVKVLALVAYFSLSFGLMFAIAIANRHTFSPVAARRLPAIAALTGAITLAAMVLLVPAATPAAMAAETVIFAVLLWGLLNLARTVPDGQTGVAVSMVMIVTGVLCMKVFDHVR